MVVFGPVRRSLGSRDDLARSLRSKRDFLMEVSRHLRVEAIQGYVRRASLFKGIMHFANTGNGNRIMSLTI